MKFIAVVDYGMGNLRSVVKALEHVAPADTRVRLVEGADDILEADRVVFPGQGAARDCMAALRDRKLIPVLTEAATTRPFLGICMGLQVLMDRSDENGGTDCLGLIAGGVRRFEDHQVDAQGQRLKIPHMGWNQVHQTRAHPLWEGIDQDSRFYFVHSYHVVPASYQVVAGTTQYGLPFASAVAQDHIFAIQCHPEKSAAPGLTLLKNFMHWTGGV
ncbi:imidazole glycerol phosphate synthase [Ectothiorhodospira haloalkaliphila]|uniref:Imidazole glycerol phosphate synthase subunit HisH n=1 Tax=Ectothiorhodospira haloalkaliphila TaxID=421628 RepID=W8KM74_9GAMM|nr:imidazole glycerol phosphate synthase subunit HisH [Ectothiorhodospira haloalkaliphila]AHK78087.1 imidazole glycerol phosphate synthase [Ectothiorhodospira haloalkaliphila]